MEKLALSCLFGFPLFVVTLVISSTIINSNSPTPTPRTREYNVGDRWIKGGEEFTVAKRQGREYLIHDKTYGITKGTIVGELPKFIKEYNRPSIEKEVEQLEKRLLEIRSHLD